MFNRILNLAPMKRRFVHSIRCSLLHIDKSSITKGVRLAISLVKWLHLPYAIVVRMNGLEDDLVTVLLVQGEAMGVVMPKPQWTP